MRLYPAWQPLLLAFSLFCLWASPVGAQQYDIRGKVRKMIQLAESGNYPAARLEAQTIEPLVEGSCVNVRAGCAAEAYGLLANVYMAAGDYGRAEKLYRRILAMDEAELGATPIERKASAATARAGLAMVYKAQGKKKDAKELLTGVPSNEFLLGAQYEEEGRYAEAVSANRRYLKKLEGIDMSLEGSAWSFATVEIRLANLYRKLGRDNKAEPRFRHALATAAKWLGPEQPLVGDAYYGLATIRVSQEKYSQAEKLFTRALAIRQKTLGPNHPDVAVVLDSLSALYAKAGDIRKALDYSGRAIKVADNFRKLAAACLGVEGVGGIIEHSSIYYRRHVANLALAGKAELGLPANLAAEAFETAQLASQSAAANALQQMAARASVGSDALARLVRKSQDLAQTRQTDYQELVKSYSSPAGRRNEKAIDSLREKIAMTEAEIDAAASRMQSEFPHYAALVGPQPLSSVEASRLLGPDEALVFYLVDDAETFIFAVTKEGMEWKSVPVGASELTVRVARFRQGLDVGKFREMLEAGHPKLFDLALANALYETLVAPVEPAIANKRRLLIVPSGVLTALPMHLLVSERFAGKPKSLKDYRDAAWLLRKYAISVLPSVSGLKTLRAPADERRAARPMVAFADPVFSSPGAGAKTRGASSMTAAYSDFWQGASVSPDALRQALPRLKETADEVLSIAKILGADRKDIHLRSDASETAVKHIPLNDFRVVYFATHGLVAGDVKGLGEPSLALTIPDRSTDEDDGLLTASEVAQLKLDADWVVLSACNTIAGEKPGAEALSGLARAFFYAGAKALLVSHWAVDSAAATRLASATFEKLAQDPKMGKAEALRRSMLGYMNDPTDARHAYPAFWAPFELVGEGGPR